MRMKKARIGKGECFFVHLCGIEKGEAEEFEKKITIRHF